MSQRLRNTALLMGFILLLIGAFCGVVAGSMYYRQYVTTKNWPTLTTEVITGSVYERQPHGFLESVRGTVYGARWLVRYQLYGSIFDSTVNLGYESRNRGHMQRHVDEHPAGSKMQVRYSPASAGNIVLAGGSVRERLGAAYPLAEIAVPALVVGVILVLVGRRASE